MRGISSNHVIFISTLALLTCVQFMHCSAPGKYTFDFDACNQLMPKCQILGDRNGFGDLSAWQLRTLELRFVPGYPKFPGDFQTWNNLRQSDGFLCRVDEDCEWINKKLYCREENVSASAEVKVIVIVLFSFLFNN